MASVAVFSSKVLAADLSLSDKHFLKAASQAGEYEIEGSKLALNKTKRKELKTFAKVIIEERSKAAAELKAVACKKELSFRIIPAWYSAHHLSY